MRNSAIFSALVVLLIGCDASRVYEDFNDMDEAFWHKDSVQRFHFLIENEVELYNLKSTFRNASSYPFYNLYFQWSLTDSSGQVILEELKDVNFFDPKTGEPLGSGLGDLFDHSFTLKEDYQFAHPGKYTLSLQQYMRRDTLPFVLSVGGRVERASH